VRWASRSAWVLALAASRCPACSAARPVNGLLSADGILGGRCIRDHHNSFFGTLQPGVSRGAMGLRGLGIGDGLDAVSHFAHLGLGLLELALGGQRIVAGHGAGNFFRLTLDRVDQTLTCLVSLVVLSHLSLLSIALLAPAVVRAGNKSAAVVSVMPRFYACMYSCRLSIKGDR